MLKRLKSHRFVINKQFNPLEMSQYTINSNNPNFSVNVGVEYKADNVDKYSLIYYNKPRCIVK